VVASAFDPSTERIVRYLFEEYEVQINAVFFRCFRDGDREYLSRAWLVDPVSREEEDVESRRGDDWNGEYYVNYSEDRHWPEAVKYGFVSAGGGSWYSKPLHTLEPGDRIWVNVPGRGFVGVGKVLAPAVSEREFRVRDSNGEMQPVQKCLNRTFSEVSGMDPETSEYYVRVQWLKTVPIERAFREKGFFGNQLTVARPKTPKWDFTIRRLREHFEIGDDR
jgi:hypothetical protein